MQTNEGRHKPRARKTAGGKLHLYLERQNAGYTQQQLADIAHMSRSGYTHIESGFRKGTDEFWQIMSEILGKPEDYLRTDYGHVEDY